MSVFFDTSAVFAMLDRDEDAHARVRDEWVRLVAERAPFVTTSYVVVELYALVQRRLGMEALRVLDGDVLPLVQVEWIGADDHQAAAQAVLTANRRDLSLVDCASFQVMRRLGIRTAFTLDGHFTEQGFDVIPNP